MFLNILNLVRKLYVAAVYNFISLSCKSSICHKKLRHFFAHCDFVKHIQGGSKKLHMVFMAITLSALNHFS